MDELDGRRSAGSVPELGEGPATVSMVQGEVYQVETKGDEFIVLEVWSEWLPGAMPPQV